MRNVLRLNSIRVFAVASIFVIFFQLYWHYWLVRYLGGYVFNTVAPIFVLFLMACYKEFISRDPKRLTLLSTLKFLFPLFAYVFFAVIAITLNEYAYSIRTYLIYIFCPVAIFVCLVGIFNDNEDIAFTLNVLFAAGIFISILVCATYILFPSKLIESPLLETNRGFFNANTGAGFGYAGAHTIRFTIPGISSTTYGAILIPLIFVGIYLRRYSKGFVNAIYACLVLFLLYCLFMTVSRGPFISALFGLAYLLYRKWFNVKELLMGLALVLISAFTFAKVLFVRIYMTIGAMLGMDMDAQFMELMSEDQRLLSIKDTLSYIDKNPLFGIGLSKLGYYQMFTYEKEHNNYLSIGASMGLLTLSCYVLFLFLFFRLLQKTLYLYKLSDRERDMGILLGGGTLSYIVYLNFAPTEFQFIWVWFGLTAAWMINSKLKQKTKGIA